MKLTRQQLYDRIRTSTKEEVTLSEMKRLGFWPAADEKPTLAEEFLKRKGELERELRQLTGDQRLLEDPERALQAMRKQRMLEARRKREETKKRKAQQRHDNAMRWHKRRQEEILYIGDDYSKGLHHNQSDHSKLNDQGLPRLDDGGQLAQAMGISLHELRFLTFARQSATLRHYRQFFIPKKTGGQRMISTPMPRLKRAQYWLLDNILEKVELHQNVHGFRKGRSIVSNAQTHVGKKLVINMDLENFFPTIDYPRIKGMFKSLGYSDQCATLMALLCSQAQSDEVILDGQSYHVVRGARFLPQGSPTSPTISNIICRRLDRRLQGAVRKLEFQYTRYADDLSFSTTVHNSLNLKQLLWQIPAIVSDEGFTVHTGKTRVMTVGRRQEVTGIIVNEKPSLARSTLRRFRALLHHIDKDGPQGKSWGEANFSNGRLWDTTAGFAHYVAMVNGDKGHPLVAKVKALQQKYRYQANIQLPSILTNRQFRLAAAQGKTPRDPWWQAHSPPPTLPKLIHESEPITQSTEQKPIRSAAPVPDSERQQPRANNAERTMRWVFVALLALVSLKVSPMIGIFVVAIAALSYMSKR